MQRDAEIYRGPRLLAAFCLLVALVSLMDIPVAAWAAPNGDAAQTKTISVLDYSADPSGQRDSTGALNALGVTKPGTAAVARSITQ